MDDRSRSYRAIWLSDLHLGTRACQIDALTAFLDAVEFGSLYLVGDIVDLWSLKRRHYWPASHADFLRRLVRRAAAGARVVYLPGNHDNLFRDYDGLRFGGVQIRREAFHRLADGRRMIMLHGDEFDAVVNGMPLLSAFGDACYDFLLWMTRHLHRARRRLGLRYWSLAAAVKHRVKYICQFVSDYEARLAAHARVHRAEVVLTGHIHRPEIRPLGDVLYCNGGDWIENCTALVEHWDGRLEILHPLRDGLPAAARRPAAATPAPEPAVAAMLGLA